MAKREREQLERRFDQLLAEKMELEYRFQELESVYAHEKGQREEILRLHENTRRLKHDMKNHIMVITSCLQENHVDEARHYLSRVLDELNQIYTYVETGNSVMNYVLNQKLERAYGRGIQVKAEIENLSFAAMESVDFVSLLSNLLDNAIEHLHVPAADGGAPGDMAKRKAERTPEREDGPEMVVRICARRGYEVIQVKNSIDGSVLEGNPGLWSEREGEEHGYGVRQIRGMVEKYGGLCQFYEEDGMFCAVAMIPAQA